MFFTKSARVVRAAVEEQRQHDLRVVFVAGLRVAKLCGAFAVSVLYCSEVRTPACYKFASG